MIILLSIFFVTDAQTCSGTITCNQITDTSQCYQAIDFNRKKLCDYNYTTNSCQVYTSQEKPCNQYSNEYDCFYYTYGCVWTGTKTTDYSSTSMQSNTNGVCNLKTCSSLTSEYDCSSFGSTSCDWQDGNCVTINECKNFQTVKGCRNTRFKVKCVVLVDGEVLSINTRTVLPYQSMTCVIQDCKHKTYSYDCTFVNGVQCIWGNNRCSKCADYTTYDTCTGNTGLCYWANNQCQNVECLQYTSPNSCKLKSSQCEWNQLKMKCALNSTITNPWCYSEYLSTSSEVKLIAIILLILL